MLHRISVVFHIGEMIQIVSGSKYAMLEPDNKISKCRKQLVFIDNTFSENDPSFDDAFPDECTHPHGLYPMKTGGDCKEKTLKPSQRKRTSGSKKRTEVKKEREEDKNGKRKKRRKECRRE